MIFLYTYSGFTQSGGIYLCLLWFIYHLGPLGGTTLDSPPRHRLLLLAWPGPPTSWWGSSGHRGGGQVEEPLVIYIYILYGLYIHTYMHACMHACMHTYIHTHIHIYIYRLWAHDFATKSFTNIMYSVVLVCFWPFGWEDTSDYSNNRLVHQGCNDRTPPSSKPTRVLAPNTSWHGRHHWTFEGKSTWNHCF